MSAPVTDDDLPGYLSELGVPGLADAHVHFMPQNVLDKVWAFFDAAPQRGEAAWGIRYRSTEQERVDTLARLGVAAYPSLNYAHRPGMAAWLNEYSQRFAAEHPQVVPSGTFYAEPSAGADARAALAAGARIFKVHVQVGGFSPVDPQLEPAWDALEEAGVPAVIHAGNGPHRGAFTGPGPVAELAARHPGLPIVVAHCGLPDYAAFTDLVEASENVWLDTTMIGTDYMQEHFPLPEDVLRRWAGLGERIVLGSDFPNIPYPYAHQIEALQRWGFGDAWLRRVLWDNGARLMRVGTRTERLRLTRPSLSDLSELHSLQADPRVWGHFPSGRATSLEDTRSWLAALQSSWREDGLGTWVVRGAEDEFLGYGGCRLAGGGAYWNLGYRLRPEVHGRGIATELSRAAIDAARRQDPDVPVVAYLLEHNEASAGVARKLGLTLAWRGPDAGNPDPDAVRLVFADRELSEEQLAATRR